MTAPRPLTAAAPERRLPSTPIADGWTIDVVSPEWPHDRVLLSADGGSYDGPPGGTWWHIFDADYSELRAAGFSPSGQTLAVATCSDLTLWTRAENDGAPTTQIPGVTVDLPDEPVAVSARNRDGYRVAG